MCLRGRTGAHSWAQDIRRQVGAPSVQFSPVILSNFRPVLTHGRDLSAQPGELAAAEARGALPNDSIASAVSSTCGAGASGSSRFAPAV
jgi:hypothetical protein